MVVGWHGRMLVVVLVVPQKDVDWKSRRLCVLHMRVFLVELHQSDLHRPL